MPEPLTEEERANIVQTIGMLDEGVFSKLEYFSDLLRYEATVKDRDDRIAALEAELARLRPLAEVGGFAVNERRAYKRYMAGEHGDWLEKRNVARRGVWDTADAILAQEDDGE